MQIFVRLVSYIRANLINLSISLFITDSRRRFCYSFTVFDQCIFHWFILSSVRLHLFGQFFFIGGLLTQVFNMYTQLFQFAQDRKQKVTFLIYLRRFSICYAITHKTHANIYFILSSTQQRLTFYQLKSHAILLCSQLHMLCLRPLNMGSHVLLMNINCESQANFRLIS